ncbi:hypothetical protein ACFVUW_28745 [Streptomyces xiamenensis]|uniref:hypothetical protein n=1 Tax=Streptomyces xiamenensis TaxID=408015 RepID=UPI0036E32CDE
MSSQEQERLLAEAMELESRVPPLAAGPRTEHERLMLERAAELRRRADVAGASEEVGTTLDLAVESLRQGNRMVDIALRGPLAEWLEDAAEGDDEGVISPYAEAVARALLGRQL